MKAKRLFIVILIALAAIAAPIGSSQVANAGDWGIAPPCGSC
ncbi:MAG TPA: hypothetical protein VJZ27_18730 [Aggregatilineales bacterium]|nr:hypothetical protein [Aggregatilineales bacterium]